MVAHDVRLTGPAFLGGERPAILQRPDDDLVESLLADLGSEDGRRRLAAAPSGGRDGGSLKLFQPIHQTFHVALVEAHCDSFGGPRLDPDRIDSAGLVVRRVARGKGVGAGTEGWLRQDRTLRGLSLIHI